MSASFSTSLHIDAAPDAVYDHFVRPELLVQWMGDRAQLRATDGGTFAVDINGVLIRGSYVALHRPTLIEIAWGEAGNAAMPPGATRLVIRLAAEAGGTRLDLVHDGLQPDEAAKHAIGWPHFLARLGEAATGRDPGPDPWAAAPPAHGA
ncbi:MAG: SRPBCC domain-containing protein [Alphaproteobacteria bacterium]